MKTPLNYLSVAILSMGICLPSYGDDGDYPFETGKVFVFVLLLDEAEEAYNYYVAVVPPPKPYTGPKIICKQNKITEAVDCGDGSAGNFVENTYDIIIDATKEPVPGIAGFFQEDGKTPLTKEYCSATGLSVERTGTKVVGKKQIVSYKVRVTGGSGGDRPIVIKQYCKDE